MASETFPMFDVAFIQEQGNGRLTLESQLVRDYCLKHGIQTQLYTIKRIQRRQLALTTRSFICGDMDCMHGAMRQLNIPIPAPVYFPNSLTAYLHRRVWQDTVGGLRARVQSDGQSVFAKPAGRAKIFTGRVFSSAADLYHIGTTSWREPVWCSEIVSWLSEYRVYVNGQDIVSVDCYWGNASIGLDQTVIAQALANYRCSGEAPAAYGIDFGVLSSGKTALVEANDGYALGAYQISSAAYAELLFTRWRQLICLSV
jgi:ATP-grasp domain, R2K clade family 2